MKITKTIAKKVLKIVDTGLVCGLGSPIPGRMCVEAAVCFALGEPHGDSPSCVDEVVRSFKIRLNDSAWSCDAARTKGMRRIAVAQLGSKDVINVRLFHTLVCELTIRRVVPFALRQAASCKGNSGHKAALEKAATRCEQEGNKASADNAKKVAASAACAAADAASASSAYAASAACAAADAADAASSASAAYAAAAYAAAAASAAASSASAAYAAASDQVLTICAELGIEALRQSGSPGVRFMDILCPLKEAA
jgi:hypothetical protein